MNIRFDTLHPEIERVESELARAIIGKVEIIRLALVAVVSGGHTLLQDVPGVGKTLLVKALAKALGCDYGRIQFTPDLLPSDITGVSIFHPSTCRFEFHQGPVFTQLLLADEINRTTPRTQSALLEAMEERTVTVDGTTYDLANPFLVFATENPVEFEGTFPLPEAQLDRFLFRLSLGYPKPEDELQMLDRHHGTHPLESVRTVAGPSDIRRWQQEAQGIHVDETVKQFIVDIVGSTRHREDVRLGASPRASVSLYQAVQSLSYVLGRDYAIPDDVRLLAPYVLGHRILLKHAPKGGYSGDGRTWVQTLVENIPVPRARKSSI